MQASRLRSRISIVRPVVASLDAMGGDVMGTPITLCSCWAEILALRGRELDAMQQVWAEAKFKVLIRFRDEVTIQRKDKIAWGARTLDILDAEDPDQRRREIQLICREIVA